MKFPDSAALMTDEDYATWQWVRRRWSGPRGAFQGAARRADRRDADVMWRAMSWRWIIDLSGKCTNMVRPEPFSIWGQPDLIACGGEISNEMCA